MASSHAWRCGATVRTNLYEGNGLSLLVPDGVADRPDLDAATAGPFIDELIQNSQVVAKCSSCGTLSVVDKDYNVQFFAQVDG